MSIKLTPEQRVLAEALIEPILNDPEKFAFELIALREDRLNMDWLAARGSIVTHLMNYRVEWNGDLRKRLTAYRLELGDLPVRSAT